MNASRIARIGDAADQSEFRQAIHQLHGGMMPDQEKTRDIADRRGARTDKSFDAEKRLMLLRRQSQPLRCRLAESQEAPHLIAELRKSFVVRVVHLRAARPWCDRC